MTTATVPTLLYEGYDDLTELHGAGLAAAVDAAPFRLPGWSATGAARTALTMVLSENGGENQTATAPVVYLEYSRGRESLEVQVLALGDRVARLYADAAFSERPVIAVSAGRGTVSGPSFMLDTGAHLLRATYNDGGPVLSSVDDARVEPLQRRAQNILEQVQPR